MRASPLIALLVLSLNGAPVLAQGGRSAELQAFHWLEGTWQNVRNGSYEQWWFNNGAARWEGRGFRVAANDTVVTERLAISCMGGTCEYIADVRPNPAPVHFRIVEHTATGFKSENPAHDFPKFIHYALVSENTIAATIGAGERRIGFEFRKVPVAKPASRTGARTHHPFPRLSTRP